METERVLVSSIGWKRRPDLDVSPTLQAWQSPEGHLWSYPAGPEPEIIRVRPDSVSPRRNLGGLV